MWHNAANIIQFYQHMPQKEETTLKEIDFTNANGD